MVKLPVRIDLLGGWSDQLCWPHKAAVVNVAVGWDGKYPLEIKDGQVSSLVKGIGTGLGISSIIQAGLALDRNPNADYVKEVLDWEEKEGTRGGWQDQIGAVEGGLKLLVSENHKEIEIHRLNHSIVDYLVLFDTGIRRAAKSIGDQVRRLIGVRAFDKALKGNVETALKVNEMSGREFAESCLSGWDRLNDFVEMDVTVPVIGIGHKLCGAGGGGYGVYFVEPNERQQVVAKLNAMGVWARTPQVLQGVCYEN